MTFRTGNDGADHFDYDALGNHQGDYNYLAGRNGGSTPVRFTRRDNGLNQYVHWWPAGLDYILYQDDNSPWPGYDGFPGNGVLMADGWLVASYNALNQPVAIGSFATWATGNWVYFGYDPLGRCVKRWAGDSGDVYSNPATYFHYDGWNLLQEGNNAWGPSRVYVHGNGVDEIVWSYNTFTGEQAFHQYDARGHCTLLTDSSGNALEQYEYDAFGQPYFFDATGNSIGAYDAQDRWAGYSLFGNRFLFTGREWLSDLRVYDYRNRMYQPELGRFLQPDPKEFAAGDYNLYRYCHNDPINKTDPMGLAEASVTYELQKMRIETGSHLKTWVSLGQFTSRITGNSWQQVAKAAANMAAKMAYHDGQEHYGIVFHLANSNRFWATVPLQGEKGKFYGGYAQGSAIGALRVPGYKTAAAYWSVAGHMDLGRDSNAASGWPSHEDGTNDLDVLKGLHMNGVLAIPGRKGDADNITYRQHEGEPDRP